MVLRVLEKIDRYQKQIGWIILFTAPIIDALRDGFFHKAAGGFSVEFHIARVFAFYPVMTLLLAFLTKDMENRETAVLLVMLYGIIAWVLVFVLF